MSILIKYVRKLISSFTYLYILILIIAFIMNKLEIGAINEMNNRIVKIYFTIWALDYLYHGILWLYTRYQIYKYKKLKNEIRTSRLIEMDNISWKASLLVENDSTEEYFESMAAYVLMAISFCIFCSLTGVIKAYTIIGSSILFYAISITIGYNAGVQVEKLFDIVREEK